MCVECKISGHEINRRTGQVIARLVDVLDE